MSETGTEYSEGLLREIESLRKELWGAQEMLAHVLKVVNEPVFLPKNTLTEGLPEGTQIRIDDDVAGDRFIFSLDFPDGN